MSGALQESTLNLRQEMHNISHLLTRLQWRLELGQHGPGEHELRQTVEGALTDMKELMGWLHDLRTKIEDAKGRAA